ncbi:MAG: leucyl/phenylalanyl-tRNA--protein transferase [Myxococcota bacterium]
MSDLGFLGDLAELRQRHPFPDPAVATPDGLVAYGGDLSPGRLVSAYASGIFPWYQSGPVLWFSPDPRMVLQPWRIHVGRSLRRTLARRPFELRMDSDFDAVIRGCAEAVRPDQDGTWINDDMIAAYGELHRIGLAHSVEAYEGGRLVGGLYGVSLGAAFFGESMFARAADASKVAFVHLVRQLESWGVGLVDCQVHTPHLDRFGARLWPRDRFLRELGQALASPTRVGPWSFDEATDGDRERSRPNRSTSR